MASRIKGSPLLPGCPLFALVLRQSGVQTIETCNAPIDAAAHTRPVSRERFTLLAR
jgi:hypothetical protein